MEQTCRGHHTGSGRAGVILLALALAAGSLAGCGRRNDLPVIENGTGGTGRTSTPGRLAGYAGHGSGRRGGFRGTDRQL